MIKHHFSAGGVYCREQTLEEGQEVQKHVHQYDHLSYLGSGTASVEIDGELNVFTGPCAIEIKAGKLHKIQAITDITWLCIHSTGLADHEIEKE